MDNTVVINDYRQMDKVIKEGRTYLLNICKKIKKSGCNVLLIQKSILRDAVDDTSLTFLKRLNILVVKDVERDEIDFLTKSLGCKPVADIEAFSEDKLGYADLVEEMNNDGTKVVKITGVKHKGRTVSILAMSSNQLVLDECERSIHDALCVVRCLVKKRCVHPNIFIYLTQIHILPTSNPPTDFFFLDPSLSFIISLLITYVARSSVVAAHQRSTYHASYSNTHRV
jgi:T-complex protein 1 subunit delta